MFQRPALPLFHPATVIATWFGTGLVKWAPGTWGSLAALPFAAGIVWLGGSAGLWAAGVAVFLAGLWASARYVRAHGDDDPGSVVVDEVVGQWVAVLPLYPEPVTYLVAFLAFRFFDILKPWPIGWLDRRLKGPLGIMADDVVAGIATGAVAFAIAVFLLGHSLPWDQVENEFR
jgi:phosphatidylglycerophosphatase A